MIASAREKHSGQQEVPGFSVENFREGRTPAFAKQYLRAIATVNHQDGSQLLTVPLYLDARTHPLIDGRVAGLQTKETICREKR